MRTMTTVAPAVGEIATARTRRVSLAYLAMAGVVIIWGMGPPISKLVTGPPSTIASTRIWMAVPLTYLVLRVSGSKPTLAGLKASFLGGVSFGCNMFLFFTALRHLSIATFTLLGVLQPITVSLISVRLFGERLSKWVLAWGGVAFLGVAAAVLMAGKGVKATPFGLLLGVTTISCMSVYLLASRQARKTIAPNEYLFGVMSWAAITLTIPLFFQGWQLHTLDHRDWFWMTVVLIFPGWLGHLLLNWAITEIPMSISSLNMLPSTVVSIAAAWPINHQHVTLGQSLAGLVTLVAVGLVVHGPFRPKPSLTAVANR